MQPTADPVLAPTPSASVRWGLLGVKVARATTDLGTVAAEVSVALGVCFLSRREPHRCLLTLPGGLALFSGFGACEKLLDGLSAVAAKQGTRMPQLASAIETSLVKARESLASAKAAASTGVELSSRAAQMGLHQTERLLNNAQQLELLSAALPKVMELMRQFVADRPANVSNVSLLHALYALSCIQAATGPMHAEARVCCDAVARLEAAPASEPDPPVDVQELRRMLAYAAGAYGTAALAVLRGSGASSVIDGLRADTRAGLAARLGLPITDVVLFEGSGVFRPAFFVVVDRSSRLIVIGLRGTFNVLDSLTNLTCRTSAAPGGGLAHEGMLAAANELISGDLGVAVLQLLEQNAGYGLRITGHSQGAGVAALLTAHFRRAGVTDVRGYAFAPPCVLSLHAAKEMQDCLVSVVFGDDIICRLSLGHLEDLRNAMAALAAEPQLCTRAITAVGPGDPTDDDLPDSPSPRQLSADNEEWVISLRSSLHALMQADRLYPPGRVLWIPAAVTADGQVINGGAPRWVDNAAFCEVTLSSTLFNTHLPHVYEEAILSAFPDGVEAPLAGAL